MRVREGWREGGKEENRVASTLLESGEDWFLSRIAF